MLLTCMADTSRLFDQQFGQQPCTIMHHQPPHCCRQHAKDNAAAAADTYSHTPLYHQHVPIHVASSTVLIQRSASCTRLYVMYALPLVVFMPTAVGVGRLTEICVMMWWWTMRDWCRLLCMPQVCMHLYCCCCSYIPQYTLCSLLTTP